MRNANRSPMNSSHLRLHVLAVLVAASLLPVASAAPAANAVRVLKGTNVWQVPGQRWTGLILDESRQVFLMSEDAKSVELRDLTTGRRLMQYRAPKGATWRHLGPVWADKKYVVAHAGIGGSGIHACIFEKGTGKLAYEWSSPPNTAIWQLLENGRFAAGSGFHEGTEGEGQMEVFTFPGLKRVSQFSFEGVASGLPTNQVHVASSGKFLVTTEAGKLRLWDVTTGRKLHELVCPDLPNWAKLNGDGASLLYSVEDTVVLWDCRAGREVIRRPSMDKLGLLSEFSPDGQRVAVGNGRTNLVVICDAHTGRQTATITLTRELSVGSIAWLEDDLLLVEDDGRQVFSPQSGKLLRRYQVEEQVLDRSSDLTWWLVTEENKTVLRKFTAP